jgi:hypothetical protein
MSGSEHHLGNAVAHDDHYQPAPLEARDTQNLLSLAAKFDILDVRLGGPDDARAADSMTD